MHLTIVLDDDRVVTVEARSLAVPIILTLPASQVLQFYVQMSSRHLPLTQVDGGETVLTLKAILEAETSVPAGQQLLSFAGKGLADRSAHNF